MARKKKTVKKKVPRKTTPVSSIKKTTKSKHATKKTTKSKHATKKTTKSKPAAKKHRASARVIAENSETITFRTDEHIEDYTLQYATDVVSGLIVVGPNVRLACERHIRDIGQQKEKGFYWDLKAAQRALDFFPRVLRLAGGDFEGRPFELHIAQKFIIGSLFGWKDKDGSRRFRVAYIEMAKGNGKSPLAAGIGLYMLVADKEYRAEVYSAAVDKEQAKILFRDAVAMVDLSDDLKGRIIKSGGKEGDTTRVWNLAYLKTHSFFKPIASESTGRGKSGPRPHCALIDELHEHPTNAMVEFMRAGTKGRRQALILMITNSGVVDPTKVCYQYHLFSENVLQQIEQNEHFFAYVCGLEPERREVDEVGNEVLIPGDSWDNPNVWLKSNPLLGVSITEKYLRECVQDALGMPSKQSIIRRLNFCEWVDSVDPFVDAPTWARNNAKFDKSILYKRHCVGAIDLSGKNDLSSITLLFSPDANGKRHVLQFFWTPEETLREHSQRDRAPYQQWVNEGHIEATPGKVIDYEFIAVKMRELIRLYDVGAFAFDRANMDYLERELHKIGLGRVTQDDSGDIRLVKHAQGFNDMDPSIQVLEDYLLKNSMICGDNPVLTWCIKNVKVEFNPMKLRMFSKIRSTGRIDGATTLAMAAGISKTFVKKVTGVRVTLIN